MARFLSVCDPGRKSGWPERKPKPKSPKLSNQKLPAFKIFTREFQAMPIYEYVCEDCQTRHERIVMSNGAKVECPKCLSKKQTIQFSVFAVP